MNLLGFKARQESTMLDPMAQLLGIQKELQLINCRQLIAKIMVLCNSSVSSSSVLHHLSFLSLGRNSMSWENPEICGVLPNFQLNVSGMNLRFSFKFGHGGNVSSGMSNVTSEDHSTQNTSFCKRYTLFLTIHFLLCFTIKLTSNFSSSSPSSKAFSVFIPSVSVLCFCILYFQVSTSSLFQITTKMANFFNIFTITNLLILSLALNLSLVMRVYFNDDKHGQLKAVDVEGPASKRTLLSVSSSPGEEDTDKVINLNHGDPTMYEKYWMAMGDKTTVVIPGWQSMSYFSDVQNLCWFLEPELAMQILRLHKAVGNAVTKGRHIVIGTGSSQLIMAAMFALSPADGSEPISVVSTAPFYSSYPVMSTYLKSGLFNWAGDARSFNKEGTYEFITSPNNPDGFVRTSMVNRTGGMLVHELAYYWPQYTPISSPTDHELSLFTFSKATGHAGQRIGFVLHDFSMWALVKDEEVAKRMIKFIELNTIGVSSDSQIRAAKLLEVITNTTVDSSGDSFFDISYNLMAERWRQLRAAVNNSRRFSLPEFAPGFCSFFQKETQPQPAFAWLKCEDEVVED